jgi:AraC-like DNA-binding protein
LHATRAMHLLVPFFFDQVQRTLRVQRTGLLLKERPVSLSFSRVTMQKGGITMHFVFDHRTSDSPFIELIWQTESDQAGTFTSTAVSHWEMVISRYQGQITLTVRGPETIAMPAPCPAETEFLGIQFKLGAFMPHLPLSTLVNSQLHLPEATGQSFWLHGATWQVPTFENIETFVNRLVREELLVHEPIIDAALQNQAADVCVRSVQRRFLRATGLTQGAILQIQRARHAMSLLQQGVSILDTVALAGYADQPHLTRSLKRLMGQTPAQILRTHVAG